MTQLRARVRASVHPTARLAAAMRRVIAIVRRVLGLAAEAVVRVRHHFRYVLAGTAPPALVRLGRGGPLDHAVQMHYVIAVGARPHRVVRPNLLAAHQALQFARVDFAR